MLLWWTKLRWLVLSIEALLQRIVRVEFGPRSG
jgi:hypothetical protein